MARDAKSKETSILSYESFLWAGGISGLFKIAVGRERPSDTDDPFHFKPGFRDSSFPSGHTTVAFAAATVFTEQYPTWLVAIPAYGTAGAIGFSRMVANKHWASDVLAEAALGTVVAHTLRKRHLKKTKTEFEWQMTAGNIRWVMKFCLDGLRLGGWF